MSGLEIAGIVVLCVVTVVVGPIVLLAGLFGFMWLIALLSSPAVMLFEGSTDHVKELFGGPWPEHKWDRERLSQRTPVEVDGADKWTCGRIR